MSILKDVLSQYKKWKPSVATKNLVYHFLTRERKKRYGSNNPNQTFYVIRGLDEKSPFYIGAAHHLLANYFYVISHLWYAEENGWIPIVDQKNYPVYNSLPYPVHGTLNAWEYYWKQPSNYSLNDVYQSQNVVLSKRSWFWQHDMGYNKVLYQDTNTINAYHHIMEKVPLNPDTEAYVENTYRNIFPINQRVLGVSVRYVGYSKRSYYQANGHPIAPELVSLIQTVKQRLIDWQMDRIFLACDDKDAVTEFQKAFGTLMICLQRNRTDTTQIYGVNNVNPLYWPENIYNTSLMYITEMELLSRCTALIGSITSGFRYAIIKNNCNYEYLEIMEDGLFPDSRKRIS